MSDAISYLERIQPASLCQLAGNWGGKANRGDLIETKHDGWRFLWINEKPFTRNGTPYRGVKHIEKALSVLKKQFDCSMVFDGEFVVGSGINTLAQTKAHQESGWKAGNDGVLHIFDALPLDEWKYAEGSMALRARKERLKGAFGGIWNEPEAWELGWTDGTNCPIRLVDHVDAANEYTVERVAKDVWARGGEGVVTKDANAPYRRNRNQTWLKLRRDISERNSKWLS